MEVQRKKDISLSLIQSFFICLLLALSLYDALPQPHSSQLLSQSSRRGWSVVSRRSTKFHATSRHLDQMFVLHFNLPDAEKLKVRSNPPSLFARSLLGLATDILVLAKVVVVVPGSWKRNKRRRGGREGEREGGRSPISRPNPKPLPPSNAPPFPSSVPENPDCRMSQLLRKDRKNKAPFLPSFSFKRRAGTGSEFSLEGKSRPAPQA